MKRYVIGLDYGSDSVRAVLVDTADGRVAAHHVHPYGRWAQGLYCDPAKNQFRQHPLDYLEGLEITVRAVLAACPEAAAQVAGIGIDTTGSTPCLVDASGAPLSLAAEFADNPNAMFVLWKDHTAVAEAAEINALAGNWGGIDYTCYEGGVYSSEWFWAKLLHVLREDPALAPRAASFVEHCDWMAGLLTGTAAPAVLKRSRCAAGHKAMWHASWGGLPSNDFFCRLDQRLDGWRDKMYSDTYTSDTPAGTLTPEWAKKLGLPERTVVAVGGFDGHFGAVGAGIEPYVLCKVMGTSTTDMLVVPEAELDGKLIRGICGQVDGSIIPGMQGLEAGQSAFGDLYAWYKRLMLWPLEQFAPEAARAAAGKIIPALEKAAAAVPIGCCGVTALDWMNGRRTPDADQSLTGAFSGLTLSSDAAVMFRALAEASLFGAKMIVERFRSEGVPVHRAIALGGVAKKSPWLMQMAADILNMEIKVVRSQETCALGAAMFAAVAAGVYTDVGTAAIHMESGFDSVYRPDPANVPAYEAAFARYCKLAAELGK